MCDRVHIPTQIRMKEFEQTVKFFIRNVGNVCICAHVKMFKLYRDEELEGLLVFKANETQRWDALDGRSAPGGCVCQAALGRQSSGLPHSCPSSPAKSLQCA